MAFLAGESRGALVTAGGSCSAQGRERAAGRKAANITVLALLAATNDECPLQMHQPALQSLLDLEGGSHQEAAQGPEEDQWRRALLGEGGGGIREQQMKQQPSAAASAGALKKVGGRVTMRGPAAGE